MTVTTTGTIRRVSPRKPDALPERTVKTLLAAQVNAEREQEKFKAAVREALKNGSVRQVAAAVGLSPTTVQAWSKERRS